MGKILVVGDAIIDRYRFVFRSIEGERVADPGEQNWKLNSQWHLRTVLGGPFLIRDLLAGPEAAPAGEVAKLRQLIRLRSYAEVERQSDPIGSHEKDKRSVEVWRVPRFGGYGEARAIDSNAALDPLEAGACRASTMLVIADAGNGFRNSPASWEGVVNSLDGNAIVLHKLSLPIERSPLQAALAVNGSSHPSSAHVTVVNADDLRRHGLDLSKRFSWQRTYSDLRRLVDEGAAPNRDRVNSLAAFFRDSASRDVEHRREYLIVRFDCDGAACVSHDGNIDFWCAPGAGEGDWDAVYPGMMVGTMSCFTAQLAKEMSGRTPGDLAPELMAEATRRTLEASRMFVRGTFHFDQEDEGQKGLIRMPDLPLPTADKDTRKFVDPAAELITLRLETRATGAPVNPEGNVFAAMFPRQWKMAIDYLSTGEEALKDVPYARFGDLLSVDQDEIEGFRLAADLFRRHLSDSRRNKPVSIGVFGPPGSGKSFGVKQVAEMVAGKRADIVEFNVSQFAGASLGLAMHRIRDALLGGKKPICLFDEFDADGLAHVKRFLAPMQDGTFEDEGVVRPIGAAIFVFLGGVFSSYARLLEHERKQDNKAKELKLPDFVSRLSGYVDIRGPNAVEIATVDEGDPTPLDLASIKDADFLLRRAILLRSQLKRSAPGLFLKRGDRLSMDPPLRTALLGIPRFLHGARSIEAIIRMSSVKSASTHFPVSALPIDGQLRLHVDPAKFRELIALGDEAVRLAGDGPT